MDKISFTMKLYVVLNVLTILCPAGLSKTILGFGISTVEEQQIVDLHNNFRLRIANGTVSGQPRGINLLRMQYDATLAEKAQEISNTTTFAHVAVSDSRWSVGQNLYMSMSTASGGTANWKSAVTAWFNEYSIYNYSQCCTSGTGHYTQVIWADTAYIGCGYTYFNSSGTYKYNKLYVCNYGPAGNWVGSYPYETGDSGCENLC